MLKPLPYHSTHSSCQRSENGHAICYIATLQDLLQLPDNVCGDDSSCPNAVDDLMRMVSSTDKNEVMGRLVNTMCLLHEAQRPGFEFQVTIPMSEGG